MFRQYYKDLGRKLNRDSLKHKNRERFGKVLSLILSVAFVAMLSCACAKKEEADKSQVPVPKPEATVNVPGEGGISSVDIDVEDDVSSTASKMVSYDIASIGRSDPFMPYDEYQLFEQVRKDSIAEANAYNAEIAKIKRLQFVPEREADDISPYSFNLPVPPTELASEDAAAAKITRTKVVGIMYNAQSPSAIINVDEKDYLVRPGDKIIGQEYKIMKINPTWITVSLGHNIYSAAVGEQFSRDEIIEHSNDIYDLKNRFGGRKS